MANYIDPRAPIYRFQSYEEPITQRLTELEMPGGDDAPNLYGRVIGKQGDVRIRKGVQLFSVWAGPKLILTTSENERLKNYVRLFLT